MLCDMLMGSRWVILVLKNRAFLAVFVALIGWFIGLVTHDLLLGRVAVRGSLVIRNAGEVSEDCAKNLDFQSLLQENKKLKTALASANLTLGQEQSGKIAVSSSVKGDDCQVFARDVDAFRSKANSLETLIAFKKRVDGNTGGDAQALQKMQDQLTTIRKSIDDLKGRYVSCVR
jgi:hypothetical protein